MTSGLQEGESGGAPSAPSTEGRTLHYRRIALNLGSVVAINLLAFVTGPILARALGPTDRGVLTAAMLWPQLVSWLLTFSVMDGVTYYVSGAPARARLVLGASTGLAALQSALILGMGTVVVWLTMHHFGTAAVVSGLIFLAARPAEVYMRYVMAFFNGLHRYWAYNGVQLLSFVANAAALAVLWGLGVLTVRTAVLAASGSIVLAVAFGLVLARSGPGLPQRLVDRDLSRRLLSFGFRSHLSGLPHLLNDRVDQLVISVALPAHDLGLYVIGATIATVPAFVGAAVAISVLPTLAKPGPASERTAATRRALLLTTAMTLSAAVVLVATMHPLVIAIFGRPFAPVVGVARVLVLAAVPLSLARVLHGVLKGLGRPVDAGISEGGALVVTAVGLAVLLPTVGLMGAAITSVCAYVTSVAIGLRLACRALDVSLAGLFRGATPA